MRLNDECSHLYNSPCLSTFMRRVAAPNEAVAEETFDSIDIGRWESLHKEVQDSEELRMFIQTLYMIHTEHGVPIENLLATAFSHGVIVGIQMEKQEE